MRRWSRKSCFEPEYCVSLLRCTQNRYVYTHTMRHHVTFKSVFGLIEEREVCVGTLDNDPTKPLFVHQAQFGTDRYHAHHLNQGIPTVLL